MNRHASEPEIDSHRNRREFLARSGGGFGAIALTAMMADFAGHPHADAASTSGSAGGPLAVRTPHFTPRVDRIIYLFMHGGPSHVDLFDPKPELIRYHGQPLPDSFGEVMTRRKVAANPLLGPVSRFRRRGQSGMEISDLLPEIASCADDLCVIRSCHGDSVNHPQSVYQMNTGSILMGKPSLGSWVAYGLGSENQNMPAFVVFPDPGGGIKGGPPAWGSGFLPASFQGTPMRAGRNPILHLKPPQQISDAQQQGTLNLIRRLNQRHHQQHEADDELASRIDAYELAFRMQTTAPEVVDLTGETQQMLRLYGIDRRETAEFGTRCLLARRMMERGVRFVQLYSGDTNGWDAHNDVARNHGEYCRATDRPVAALLKDLKQRGLWQNTLIIWGGEFGRMPMSEQGTGRDHNPWGYTVWLSGGAVKGGTVVGATDDVGLRAVTNTVHVHDLHATILHLLGFDHEQLTYFHNGREERLTDVAGRVVNDVLA